MVEPVVDSMRRGSDLTPEDQRVVLQSFTHRYTRTHIPGWVHLQRKLGTNYPIQFDSDQDWLENTLFHVKKNGRLDQRFNRCESSPTWPDGSHFLKLVGAE